MQHVVTVYAVEEVSSLDSVYVCTAIVFHCYPCKQLTVDNIISNVRYFHRSLHLVAGERTLQWWRDGLWTLFDTFSARY